jgi:hypothetical protein
MTVAAHVRVQSGDLVVVTAADVHRVSAQHGQRPPTERQTTTKEPIQISIFHSHAVNLKRKSNETTYSKTNEDTEPNCPTRRSSDRIVAYPDSKRLCGGLE